MTKKRVDIEVRQTGAKKAESGFKSLGASVAKTAASFAVVGVAIAGVTSLLKSSIEKYAAQELAEKKLQSALGHTSQALLDQAAALQQVSSYGDERIIEAQALIASFVKEEGQIKAATKATLDLAAAKNMDLTAAADLVSKTLGSTTNALSRYGIQVEGAVGSTARLESLTKNIAKAFGGQAAAQAKTLTGRMKSLDNVWGDFLETLGGVLSGPLSAALKGLTAMIKGIDKAFKHLADSVFITKERLDSARESTKDLALHFRANAIALSHMRKATDATLPSLAKMTSAHQEAGKAIDPMTTEFLKLADVLKNQPRELTDAEKAWNAYVKKQKESEREAKQNADFALRYAIANNTVKASITDLTDSMIELKNNVGEDGPLKLLDVPQLNEDVSNASEGMYILGKSAADAANFAGPLLASAFVGQWERGQNALKAFGEAFKRMILQMVAQIAANSIIFAFISALNPAGGIAKAGLSSFLGFASGGTPPVGKPSLVGERGPELFVPNVAGTVVPNDKLGQNVTVNITGNVLTKSFVEDEVIPQIQTAIRRAG